MPWFSTKFPEFFPEKFSTYSDIERVTPADARQRRVVSTLEKHAKALEADPARLSRSSNALQYKLMKDRIASIQSELDTHARRLKFLEPESRAHKTTLSRAFQLMRAQQIARVRADAARQRLNMMQASAGDRRFFNPDSTKSFKRTVFGTTAWTKFLKLNKQQFLHRGLVLPCIQRVARREVMFAKRHAGKGHRVPHKLNPLSNIWC